MDRNADGLLSYREFVDGGLLAVAALQSGSGNLLHELSFRIVDQNRDGTISAAELLRWMKWAQTISPKLYEWTFDDGTSKYLDPRADCDDELWAHMADVIFKHCGLPVTRDARGIPRTRRELSLEAYMRLQQDVLPLGNLVLRTIFREGLGGSGLKATVTKAGRGVAFERGMTFKVNTL